MTTAPGGSTSRTRLTPTQARRARRARRQRRRRIYIWAGGIAVGLIASTLVLSIILPGLPLQNLFQGGTPDGPGLRIENQGQTHVSPGEDHPQYNSVPPTSGWHYDLPLAPARWGIYDEPIADEVLLHNLEHGYINVHYDCPEGCPELEAQLTGLVQEGVDGGGKLLMSPYTGMDNRIALTAWTFLDRFDEFDEDRIRAFVNAHESSPNAPEYRLPR